MLNENSERNEGCRTGKVVAAICVFYISGLFLNAEGVLRNASRMQYGRMHDYCVMIMSPIASVSRLTGLSSIRTCIERWITEKSEGDKNEQIPE